MATKEVLEKETVNFFSMHWNPANVNVECPGGWEEYSMKGPMKNRESPGCYALMNGENVVYVGSAVSRGAGIYINHGLGKRIGEYTRVKDWGGSTKERTYKFVDGWEGKVDSIITLGFHKDFSYLVPALEAFLIKKIEGLINVKKIQ